MSLRAVILGLFGAALIAGVGYLNDQVLRGNFLVGNHFPISVFGGLIVVTAAVNPLLFRLRRSWSLRPSELAVAVALVLVGCSVPGSSLMRVFTPALVMPIHHNATNTGWQKNRVLSYVPPSMMPGEGKNDPRVVGAFRSGLGRPGAHITLDRIPWDAWEAPLLTWIPLIFLAGVCAISMSLIVHSQWARRERLRYPIAEFATTVMERGEDRATGSIFRSRLFWFGVAVTFSLHLINGVHAWFPNFIEIPLEFSFPLWEKFPLLGRTPNAWRLLTPILYPTVIAFAYFLASDVAFSLGFCQVLFVVAAAVLVTGGIDISQAHFTGGPFMWQRFASYLTVAFLIGYAGRNYYARLLKRAFLLSRGDRLDASTVWATRIFLLASAGMVLIVWRLGLDLPLSVLAVGMLLLIFLVMARINAETGLFLCQPLWKPIAVLIGLFGYHALGVQGLVILGLFTAVLTIDPRESLMPFVVNALKMCDDARVRVGRVGWAGVLALAVALAVAVPVVLWANYNFGVQTADKWSTEHVPTDLFDMVSDAATRLTLSGQLQESNDFTAWQRLTHMDPDRRFLWAFAAGVGGVLALSALRRRFPWWPLHPVAFLVAGTWTMEQFSHSFLLGWAIKGAVTKLGGGRTYRRFKPFMIGIIAGDLLGGLLFMAIGAAYYALTGLFPTQYHVFPD